MTKFSNQGNEDDSNGIRQKREVRIALGIDNEFLLWSAEFEIHVDNSDIFLIRH